MQKTILSVLLAFFGCASIPDGVEPVKNFNAEKYTGRWYEIARLDHPFERGLTRVYTEYSLRDDGSVSVLNRGYSPEEKEWKQIRGRAYFVKKPNVGRLKVTFFWPFFGSYNVIEVNEAYTHALVTGGSRDYLWILARKKTLPDSTVKKLLNTAEKLGFETDNLIYVEHDW